MASEKIHQRVQVNNLLIKSVILPLFTHSLGKIIYTIKNKNKNFKKNCSLFTC